METPPVGPLAHANGIAIRTTTKNTPTFFDGDVYFFVRHPLTLRRTADLIGQIINQLETMMTTNEANNNNK